MATYMVLLLGAAVISWLFYLWDTYSYWRRKGVVGPAPLPLVGNYLTVLIFLEHETDLLQRICLRYPRERFIGIYRGTQPVLLPVHPHIVKQIMVVDYGYFFSKILFPGTVNIHKAMSGTNNFTRWKALRTVFSPVYTKAKIAKALPLIDIPMRKYAEFLSDMAEQDVDHDISYVQKKFAIEIVGALTLGREIGCFSDDNDIELRTHRYNELILNQKQIHRLAIIFPFITKFIMPIVNETVRQSCEYYNNIIFPILKANKTAKQNLNSYLEIIADLKGKDLMTGDDSLQTVDDEVISQQIFVTWFVNYMNTANGISMALHELAHNQQVQRRLQLEVDEVLQKNNGIINIEALTEMKYLDMVIDETLRKYTSNGYLTRICQRRYTIPDSNVTIDKGVLVNVSLHALHYNPEYFPDPEVFDPDRFSPENGARLPSCVYAPFGIGPRNCIGQRLAKAVLAVGLAGLLREYEVLPPKQKQLKPWTYTIGNPISGGIWVRLIRRDK